MPIGSYINNSKNASNMSYYLMPKASHNTVNNMQNTLSALKQLVEQSLTSLSSIKDDETLETWQRNAIGKYGFISEYNKKVKDLDASLRASYGQQVQSLRIQLENAYDLKLEQINTLAKASQASKTPIYDAFKPDTIIGSLHPLTYTKNQVIDMFLEQGYEHLEGPDIDTIANNFDFLNTPLFHPSRHDTDTFYFNNSDNLLLRTHTTTMQSKAFQHLRSKINAKNKATSSKIITATTNPNSNLKLIMSGNVYRRDSDATHSPMFTQFEGLMLSKDFTASHLKSWILSFIHKLLPDIEDIQFRPSFFPFTYCSAEVDIKLRGSKNWLELLGCGIVHPDILSRAQIPNEYHGLAFGMGLERLTMLKYGITNLKLMHRNDPLWLQTFKHLRY